jgi:hypothetical protein
MRSKRGPFLVKERYGIVQKLCQHYMEVVVLDTSSGSGPMHKPPEKRVNCFKVKLEGTKYVVRDKSGDLVEFTPGQGIYDVSPDIEFKAAVGANGDITNIIRLEYDTRIWGHGLLSDVPRFSAQCADKVTRNAIAHLPADRAIAILETQLQRARERKERETVQEQTRKLREERDEEARGKRAHAHDTMLPPQPARPLVSPSIFCVTSLLLIINPMILTTF